MSTSALRLKLGIAWLLLGGWLGPVWAEDLSPQELVERMRAAFGRVQDYTCRLIERNFRRQDEFSESDYAFKKPHLIKLVGRVGRSKGAVVILGKDGKAGLRKNGFPIPSFLVREELRDFSRSDFGSLLEDIEQALEAGAEASVTLRGDAYLLRIVRGRRVHLYAVGAQSYLPMELLETVDGQRVSLTEWRDLQLNVGLPEEAFQP
ncbi:MAG: hypothetical protein ACUVR8_12670 [Acidobacteriota bacterium]